MGDMARRILVTGRVQGVGFRAFVAQAATECGVRGWVPNLRDDRVEAVADGDATSIAAWLDRCRSGPPGSRVTALEESEVGPESGSGFRILPTR
jgi:acylphosphatase